MPRPAIALRAIRQGAHLGGLKTCQALILVVIEHREHAKAWGVERTGHRHDIDRPVDDNEGGTGGLHHLLTVRDNDLRQRHVRRILGDKERLAGFSMGDDGVRAGHTAASHGDLALVHRRSAPIGHHVPIDLGELAGLVRHQRGQQRRCSIDAFELP